MLAIVGISEGSFEAMLEGDTVGFIVLGIAIGKPDDLPVGNGDGDILGIALVVAEGWLVVWLWLGFPPGIDVCCSDGLELGARDFTAVGSWLGALLGVKDGFSEGLVLGVGEYISDGA